MNPDPVLWALHYSYQMTFFLSSGARVRTTAVPVSRGVRIICQIMYSLAGVFGRNNLGFVSVIPSEQTASSYITLYVIKLGLTYPKSAQRKGAGPTQDTADLLLYGHLPEDHIKHKTACSSNKSEVSCVWFLHVWLQKTFVIAPPWG